MVAGRLAQACDQTSRIHSEEASCSPTAAMERPSRDRQPKCVENTVGDLRLKLYFQGQVERGHHLELAEAPASTR